MLEAKISVSALVIVLVGVLVYFLSPILTPFLLAALIAYLGDPLIDRLHKWHVPRGLGVLILFLLIFVAILWVIIGLFPMIKDQFVLFVSNVPAMLTWLQSHIIQPIGDRLGFKSAPNITEIKATVVAHLNQAGGLAHVLFKAISVSGFAILDWAITIVLVPVVAFYLMKDWPRVVRTFRDMVPTRYQKTTFGLVNQCDEVLGAFVRGQLIVMLCLGVIYSVGLSLVGLNVALIVGLLAGLVSIVPYLGFAFGSVLALIAAAIQFQDVWHVLAVIVVFAIGQMIESMGLTPWLIGSRIGLHPVAVIFAILAGGQLFGFIGILLALPVASVLMVLFRYWMFKGATS